MQKWHEDAVRSLLKRLDRIADDVELGYQKTITITPSEAQMLLVAFNELMPKKNEGDPDA